ncbi:MAG: Histone acetyltransferase HPA2-like acetyltransferase [Paucimonas sp.]|nr:Histone acetyltransferase HPA2-like acetyltransferase [Paucimonas sp.]
MATSSTVTRLLNWIAGYTRRPVGGKKRSPVLVKALSERHRRRLLRHFLALGPDDRLLRFGSPLTDELVERYVAGLDFQRDVIFGVFDSAFRLVGVAHLAFAPREARPWYGQATVKEQVGEFGVSVAASARGRGIGSRLFERAAMHFKNADIDTLYMHCLSSNATMMHIAKKAGMQIQRAYGEADAYLKLEPASPASIMQEAVDDQLAAFDYTFKAYLRAIGKWLRPRPGQRSGSDQR